VDPDDGESVVGVGRDHARTYGTWRSQLMHVSVQKFTRTTWPRSSAGPSGSDPSHSATPANGGICSRSNMVLLPQRPERRANLF